jgi:hypothetical protein
MIMHNLKRMRSGYYPGIGSSSVGDDQGVHQVVLGPFMPRSLSLPLTFDPTYMMSFTSKDAKDLINWIYITFQNAALTGITGDQRVLGIFTDVPQFGASSTTLKNSIAIRLTDKNDVQLGGGTNISNVISDLVKGNYIDAFCAKAGIQMSSSKLKPTFVYSVTTNGSVPVPIQAPGSLGPIQRMNCPNHPNRERDEVLIIGAIFVLIIIAILLR